MSTTIGASHNPPNLQIGGVKMRERNKGHQPLRVINQNRTNDSYKIDEDEKGTRNNGRQKYSRKIIRAGSLVRK